MKPQRVKLNRADGTTINCELIHDQPAADGTDCWIIANAVYQGGDVITAKMPPDTILKFQSMVEPDDIDITHEDDEP